MTAPTLSDALERFPDDARRAVYEVIRLRRDVRHFDPSFVVDDETLTRVLDAAHRAPSVGFSQPWGFIVVRERAARAAIRASFLTCREAEAARFPPGRREQYLALRLEGIEESSVNVCVVVDLRPRGEAILGTTVQPEAVRASACCAVQNLWLAARAEGLGVGWVSIVEPAILREHLALPAGVEPIAYLCVGRPRAFRQKPMLEEAGWLPRRTLESVVHANGRWEERGATPTSTSTSTSTSSSTPTFEHAAAARALEHQRLLTKPKGSLGRLEEIAAWYAGARGVFPVDVPENAALGIFAADHGVVVEGVSAYGSESTAAMVANVMAGGAASSVLARRLGVVVHLVDVGIAGDLSYAPREPVVPLHRAKVRAGTRNLRVAPAMTARELDQALAIGASTADRAIDAGATVLLTGEIGIGNTTAAAALVCAFTGRSPELVVGRGTGIDDTTLARKRAVVADALALHRDCLGDPRATMAALGGLELAALAGFVLRGAARRVPTILDGFLSGAVALFACAVDPPVRPYLLASHASAEAGARMALAYLELTPLLDLSLRLGEGTGALLALDPLRHAVALQRSMATFATAGIVGRAGADLPEAF